MIRNFLRKRSLQSDGTHLLLDIRWAGGWNSIVHEKTSTEANVASRFAKLLYGGVRKASMNTRQSLKLSMIRARVSLRADQRPSAADISTMEQPRRSRMRSGSKPGSGKLAKDPFLTFIGTGSLDNPISVLPV